MMDSRYWANPLLNAIATNNKAYYYYCTAKAALWSQSLMGGKRGGGARGSKRLSSNGTAGAPNAQPQHPANAGLVPARKEPPELHASDISNQFGVTFCPECKTKFNDSTYRPVQEGCGHIKCRSCLIRNEDGCKQCKRSAEVAPTPSSTLVVSRVADPQFPSSNAITHGSSSNNAHSVRESADPTWGTTGDPINRRSPPKRKILSNTVSQETRLSFSSSLELTPLNSHNEYGVDVKRCRKKEPLYYATPIDATAQCKTELACEIAVPPRNGITIHRVNRQVGQPLELLRSQSNHATDAVSTFYNQPPRNATANPNHVPDWTASLEVIGNGNHVQVRNSSHISDDSEGSQLGTICPSQLQQLQLPGQVHNETGSLVSLSCENSNSTTDDAGENSQKNNTGEKKKKKRSPVFIHEHIKILSGDPQMYQCSICTKKFKTKAHIKYHEFCQNGEKPYRCEQCGQGFIAKSHYEYHLRTHTGERPYVCPKCGKGFNQRGKVTRHMRSHTGEKPFHCDTCGRGFANAQAMRSHFLTHTGERPFACEHCNKRFTGMTNLKKHIITHTGERPFMCGHCGKSFGLKWTLDLHMRTHSSERPYACDQCSRAFSNSKDLRRHLVIHSGERPFKCWLCGTAFRRKDNLDRHIKNTHNQPREVAKQLANQAAAEYLAATKAANDALASGGAVPIASTSTSSSPMKASSLISAASRMSPTAFRRINAKKTKTSRTPSTVPPSVPPIGRPDNSDLYILPNDGLNVPVVNAQIEPVETKPEISQDDESTNSSTELYTELRPVQEAVTEGPPLEVRRSSCEEIEASDTDVETAETTATESEQPTSEKVDEDDDILRSGTIKGRTRPSFRWINGKWIAALPAEPNVEVVENPLPEEPHELLSSGSTSPDAGSHAESSGKNEIAEFLQGIEEHEEEDDILAIPRESLIGWKPNETRRKVEDEPDSGKEGANQEEDPGIVTEKKSGPLEAVKAASVVETDLTQHEPPKLHIDGKVSSLNQEMEISNEKPDEAKVRSDAKGVDVAQLDTVEDNVGEEHMDTCTEDKIEQIVDKESKMIPEEKELAPDNQIQVPASTDVSANDEEAYASTNLGNSADPLELEQNSCEPASNSEEKGEKSMKDESMEMSELPSNAEEEKHDGETLSKFADSPTENESEKSPKPSKSDSKEEEQNDRGESPNSTEVDAKSVESNDLQKSSKSAAPDSKEEEQNDQAESPQSSETNAKTEKLNDPEKSSQPAEPNSASKADEENDGEKSAEQAGQDSKAEENNLEESPDPDSEEGTHQKIITSSKLEVQAQEEDLAELKAPPTAAAEVASCISEEPTAPNLETAPDNNNVAGYENGVAAVANGGNSSKPASDVGEDFMEISTIHSAEDQEQAELQERTKAEPDESSSDPELKEIEMSHDIKLELEESPVRPGSPSSACSTSSDNSESQDETLKPKDDAKEVMNAEDQDEEAQRIAGVQVSGHSEELSLVLDACSATESADVSLEQTYGAVPYSETDDSGDTSASPPTARQISAQHQPSENSGVAFPLYSVRDFPFHPWENTEPFPPGYVTAPMHRITPSQVPEMVPRPEFRHDPFADGVIMLCGYSRFLAVPNNPGRKILQFCETLGYRASSVGSPEYIYTFVDSPQEISNDPDCTVVVNILVTTSVLEGHLVMDCGPLITTRVSIHKFNEYKMQLPFCIQDYPNGLRIITMLSQNPRHLAMINSLQGFRYMLMEEYCCNKNTAIVYKEADHNPPGQNGALTEHSDEEEPRGKGEPVHHPTPKITRSVANSCPLDLVAAEDRAPKRSHSRPEILISTTSSGPALPSENLVLAEPQESRLVGLARAIAQVGEMDRSARREQEREMAAQRHALGYQERMEFWQHNGPCTSKKARRGE